MSSPFVSGAMGVSGIMLRVLLALLPGIAVHVWQFGVAVLAQIVIASAAALAAEALMLRLRRVPLKPFLSDLSAPLTAWLLAVSLPPFSPWWLTVVATGFAIVVAKQLYGGLGSNVFNPAMVGYAVAIIAFPAYMTQWPAPAGLGAASLSAGQQLSLILGGGLPQGLGLDALTMATPLDTLKTQLGLQHTMGEIAALPVFGHLGGSGAEWLALAWLAGGAYLLAARIITWQVPAAFIAGLGLTALLFHGADPDRYAGPLFHLATGGAMLGAFFIATDPVSGPTTPRGKLIFGAGIGALVYLIRVFGGYPDGVAFAVLIGNICAPLIDSYTQPRVFGQRKP